MLAKIRTQGRELVIRSIGIVGKGAFGSFVEDRLNESLPRVQVLTFDQYKASSHSLREVAQCDMVILAVSIENYAVAMRQLMECIRADAIFIDVCTVKLMPIRVANELAPQQPRIHMHPLFGRQSWEDHGMSLKDLQLVICEVHHVSDCIYRLVRKFLRRLGLDIREMTADEHDRNVVAYEQFLTHYGGRLIEDAEFGLNRSNVHTLSAQHFFRAMNIVRGHEALFWAVYDANPHCAEAAGRFEQAVLRMREKRLARAKP